MQKNLAADHFGMVPYLEPGVGLVGEERELVLVDFLVSVIARCWLEAQLGR